MTAVQFFVTGFSSFAGVKDNPTERLIGMLDDRLLDGGSPDPAYRVLGTKVLPVAGHAVQDWLDHLYSAHLPEAAAPDAPVVLLHMGVDVGGRCFKLEQAAANEASFRVPDEAGWQPRRQRVDTHPGLTLASTLHTDIDAAELAAKLAARGHDVQPSSDAGRFVCNLTFYRSLLHSQLARERRGRPLHALFLHVPPADVVPLHRQLHLLLDLLRELAAQLAAAAPAAPLGGAAAAAQAEARGALHGGEPPAAAPQEAAQPDGDAGSTPLAPDGAALQAAPLVDAATGSGAAAAEGQRVAAGPD